MHLSVCDVLYKNKTFHETDVTERKSSAKTDTKELEEDDCQETEELRSAINIEHGQNEEQAVSHMKIDLASNAVNVTYWRLARLIRKSPVRNDALQSYVISYFLIARKDGIV